MAELHKGDFAFLQIFTLQWSLLQNFHSSANIDFIPKGFENLSSSFTWSCFYSIKEKKKKKKTDCKCIYADYNKIWTKLIQGNKNHLAYR